MLKALLRRRWTIRLSLVAFALVGALALRGGEPAAWIGFGYVFLLVRIVLYTALLGPLFHSFTLPRLQQITGSARYVARARHYRLRILIWCLVFEGLLALTHLGVN